VEQGFVLENIIDHLNVPVVGRPGHMETLSGSQESGVGRRPGWGRRKHETVSKQLRIWSRVPCVRGGERERDGSGEPAILCLLEAPSPHPSESSCCCEGLARHPDGDEVREEL
jgi:hypothetical protein